MTFMHRLRAAAERNRSLLCIGLDPDPQRIPAALHGRSDPLFAFCAAIAEATADLAMLAAPVAPPAGARARLLDAAHGERFARFTRRFAELFDVAVDRARELLRLIDRADAWEAGPDPTCALIHFQAGPRFAGADTGFVRLRAGERFPWHRHDGEEHNLILQGTCEDSLSGTLRVGDEGVLPGGTEHDFVAVGDEDVIFAVWVFGVDFTVPRPDE